MMHRAIERMYQRARRSYLFRTYQMTYDIPRVLRQNCDVIKKIRLHNSFLARNTHIRN